MEIAAAAVDCERDHHQLCDSGEDAVVGCEMTAPLVVFFVLAALAVIGAVSLILQKHPIHSALSLIVVMVALAGLVAATIVRSTDSIQRTLQTGEMSSTLGISNMIFRDFVYPFELTSFLILVAVLGATVLAQREKS